MRRILLGLVLAATLCTAADAQDTKPRTSSGSKALIFSINGFGDFGVGGARAGSLPSTLFGIDTLFSGFRIAQPVLGFGMKYYLGDDVALRGALGFGTTTASTPRANDTTGKTDDVTDLVLGFSPALEIHLASAGPVSAYVGAFASFSSSSNTTGDEADTLIGTTTKSFTSLGGGALFGVEYFPWSAVSLSAEYQFGVVSTTSSTTNKGKSKDGKSYLDLGIGAFAVNLAVYW